MIFSLDLSKQVQEVIFSRKIKKLLHPTLLSNNIPLSKQEHLLLTLDIMLNFSEHIKSINKKNSKTVGRKFHQIPKVIAFYYI